MDSCAECGFGGDDVPIDAVVLAVAGLPTVVAARLRGRDEGVVCRRPAPGVWSPLEYAGHTADAIGWYGERITRVLAEHLPRLEPFDWDAHTEQRRYHDVGTRAVIGHLRQSCEDFVRLVVDLTPAGWRREGIGSDGTGRTVAELARRAGHEAVHHGRDIRVGLDGRDLDSGRRVGAGLT